MVNLLVACGQTNLERVDVGAGQYIRGLQVHRSIIRNADILLHCCGSYWFANWDMVQELENRVFGCLHDYLIFKYGVE